MIYLFDIYELDEQNLTLSRDGLRLPLEPKALRVLLLLVENPGALLKKETILKAVWQTTYVEDSTLSRAVTLIRKQLAEDAKAPKFIETVPTLGYRFIAAVRKEERTAPPMTAEAKVATPKAAELKAAEPEAAEPDVATPEVSEPQAAELRVATLDPSADHSLFSESEPAVKGNAIQNRLPFFALALTVAVAVIAAAALWKFSAWAPSESKRSLVLVDFANTTGDTVFDDTLRQGLIVQLDQSPVLHLVNEQRVQQTLRLMGHGPETRLTPEIGREICQRIGGAAVLSGSIAPLGEQYLLSVRATDCRSGESLATDQVQVARKDDLIQALTQIARRFRTRLGESLASVSKYDTPLAEATTPSLDALRAFSEGMRINRTKGGPASLLLLERAVELDPQFAIAHAYVGRMLGDMGEEVLSARSSQAAYENRDHASEKERFLIMAAYDMQTTGDLERALETCEAWEEVYPQDEVSYGFRAGVMFRVFGRYAQAVQAVEKSIELNPDLAITYHLLALNEIALSRLDAAKTSLARAAQRGLDIPFFALDRYRLAFLEANDADMNRIVAQGKAEPITAALLGAQQAATLAYTGRLKQSRDVSQALMLQTLQSGRQDSAARLAAAAALREAFLGEKGAASQLAVTAQSLSHGRDAAYGTALAFALIQDNAHAVSIVDDLERRFPQDTSVRFSYVPVVRAVIALNQGQPAQALDILKIAAPYERGIPRSAFSGFYGTLYPVYVRGEAYLAQRRGAEAAAAFQTIIDSKQLVINDIIGALAYLGLGEAEALAGHTDKARAALDELMKIWSAADPDVPTLKRAQAARTALH